MGRGEGVGPHGRARCREALSGRTGVGAAGDCKVMVGVSEKP